MPQESTTTKGRQMSARSRIKANATRIVGKLIKCVDGEVEMTATQVNAARILLGKVVPDMKAVEHSGRIEVDDAREMSREMLLDIAAGRRTGVVEQTGRATDAPGVH